VIDYAREDFTTTATAYDLILDAVGNHPPSALRRVLKPNGICVMAGGTTDVWMIGPLVDAFKALALSSFGSRKLVGILARSNNQDLGIIRDLIAAGKVTPVIDRRYPLSEVPEAIRYLETGHAQGKVIITCDSSG
jgi:NADPH:quinone reductase-like Zn-dependent oxidoreductase